MLSSVIKKKCFYLFLTRIPGSNCWNRFCRLYHILDHIPMCKCSHLHVLRYTINFNYRSQSRHYIYFYFINSVLNFDKNVLNIARLSWVYWFPWCSVSLWFARTFSVTRFTDIPASYSIDKIK